MIVIGALSISKANSSPRSTIASIETAEHEMDYNAASPPAPRARTWSRSKEQFGKLYPGVAGVCVRYRRPLRYTQVPIRPGNQGKNDLPESRSDAIDTAEGTEYTEFVFRA
jgi:hypothetical protein